MVVVLLIIALTISLTGAEQTSCTTGRHECAGYISSSIVNSKYYCCKNGFTLQWINDISPNKRTSKCVCDRQYYERDCDSGRKLCKNSNNLLIDDNTFMCCNANESMNSFRNSMINGVLMNSCKCVRYINGGSGGVISDGGVIRPMTDTERNQFNDAMNQFGESLNQEMNNLELGLDDFMRRQAGLQSSVNRAGNIMQRFGQDLRRNLGPFGSQQSVMSQSPASNNGRRTNSDFRQRRFQPRQLSGRDLNFINRRSQPQGISYYFNPFWWLLQNWRRMFDFDRSRLYNPYNFVNYDINGNLTNLNKELPSQSVNVTV